MLICLTVAGLVVADRVGTCGACWRAAGAGGTAPSLAADRAPGPAADRGAGRAVRAALAAGGGVGAAAADVEPQAGRTWLVAAAAADVVAEGVVPAVAAVGSLEGVADAGTAVVAGPAADDVVEPVGGTSSGEAAV